MTDNIFLKSRGHKCSCGDCKFVQNYLWAFIKSLSNSPLSFSFLFDFSWFIHKLSCFNFYYNLYMCSHLLHCLYWLPLTFYDFKFSYSFQNPLQSFLQTSQGRKIGHKIELNEAVSLHHSMWRLNPDC